MEHAHQPDAVREAAFELLGIELAVLSELEDLQPDPPLLRQTLPHDEIGIVFSVGDQHPIPSLPGQPLAD